MTFFGRLSYSFINRTLITLTTGGEFSDIQIYLYITCYIQKYTEYKLIQRKRNTKIEVLINERLDLSKNG